MGRRPASRSSFASLFAGMLVLAAPSIAEAQSPPAAPESIAVGDWQLTPLLQLRTRFEYRRDPLDVGGVDTQGTPPRARVRDAFAALERARLGVGAEHGALRAQLTLQDARAWGSPAPNAVLGGGTGELATFGPYEAFGEVRTSAARPTFLRIGRQAVTWGDGRLIGNADWSPTARALDAVRGHLTLGAWDFELLAAMVDPPRPAGVSAGDTGAPWALGTQLYGAQIGWAIDPLLKLELSALTRVARSDALEASRFAQARAEGELYAGSLRVFGEARGWRYAVEGAYEMGRAARLADADIAAYAGAAYLEKKFDTVLLAPFARVGADYASGDDGGATYRQFDPLLPDVHMHHGAMDALAWSNAMSAHARVGIVPWTDTRASVEYRYARMAEARGEWLGAYLTRTGRGTGGSSELGHEIDAAFQWKPWPALDLAAGYSLFVVGDGARAILAAQARGALQSDGTYAPSSLSHYGYLQATLSVP